MDKGSRGVQPTPPSAATATPTPVNGFIGAQSVLRTESEHLKDSQSSLNRLEPVVSGPFKPDDNNHVNVMHVDCKALYRKFNESSPPKKTVKQLSTESHETTDTELNCKSPTMRDDLMQSAQTSEEKDFSGSDTREIPHLSPHSNGLKHHHHGNHPTKYSYDLSMSRSLVDLRMIDFAHATHRGYQDPVEYSSVDDGYIMGLNTLIEIFQSML